MKHIVECSSLYAIDFTAILYDHIYSKYSKQQDYIVYLNRAADVDSKYGRKYISRLAIPTLSWEIDPQNQLRQIHVSIDSIKDKETFGDTIKMVLNTYAKCGCKETNLEFLSKAIIEQIQNCSNGLDCYSEMIKLLIKLVCNLDIEIRDFSGIRHNGAEEVKQYFKMMHSELSSYPQGKYKFSKGGSIEVFDELQWRSIKIILIESNKEIYYFDECGEKYSIEHLMADNIKLRLRGPIETVFLCQFGTLIDLPWYLDASFSSNEESTGIEFISPISVSSNNRVSVLSGGKGNRLIPSGYSLIEYSSPKIIEVIKKILNENEELSFVDMEDWKRLVNNYPVTNQKIAKSQSSINKYCDELLKHKFDSACKGDTYIKKIQGFNTVTMGNELVNMCLYFRYLRLISNEKSPYYRKLDYIKSHYHKNLSEFIRDITVLLDKCKSLFERFWNDAKDVDNILNLISNYDDLWKSSLCDDVCFQNNSFYRAASKIEKCANAIIRKYYATVAFVTGVLLKANIFSAYCILGDEFKNRIEDILSQRTVKCLRYKPIFIEKGCNND